MSDDDFGVAKAVSDLVKPLTPERQARILRWVSESLGVEIAADPAAAAGGATGSGAGETPRLQTSTDIKSFVNAKDPRSDNQFAATVAYYYRFEAPPGQRKESVSAETLQEATRLSGRARLGDPGKTLRNARDQGYLDAAERGEYSINTVGENLVAMTLPGQGRAAAPKPGKKASKPKKSKR